MSGRISVPRKANRSLAADRVRSELILRGKVVADLAAFCGVSTPSMSVELSKGIRTVEMLERMEAFFGYELSLATPIPTLTVRKRCAQDFGIDPILAPLDVVLPFAESIGAKTTGIRQNRGRLIDSIYAHLAANPNLKPNPTHPHHVH